MSLSLDLGRVHRAPRDRFCAVLVLVLVSQNALAYEYITARLSAIVSWLKIIFLCFFLQLDVDLTMIYVRLLLKFIRYASTPYWAGYIVAMSNFCSLTIGC